MIPISETSSAFLADPSSKSNTSSSKDGYMTQLDTVRAIAVMMVLVEHFVHPYIPDTQKILHWGSFGVGIFFVLSGFLITSILLKARDKMEIEKTPPSRIFKSFYLRRSLRILPIYYITIFAVLLIPGFLSRNEFNYLMTYSINFKVFFDHNWEKFGYLWTLAVEEQFYLIWPFVVILTPRKLLFKVIIGFALLSPFTKILLHSYIPERGMFSILTTSSFDSYGLGAILAYIRLYKDPKYILHDQARYLVIFWAIFLYFISETYKPLSYDLFYYFGVAVVAMYLVARTSIGFTGTLGVVFENPLLRWIGRVSYGIYLYHGVVFSLYPMLSEWSTSHHVYFPFTETPIFKTFENWRINTLIWTLLTIALASISFVFIETPINNLKRKFSY